MAPPTTVAGGKPVIPVPGLTPTSPVTAVVPVVDTVEPASTAKLRASPRFGLLGSAAPREEPPSAKPTAASTAPKAGATRPSSAMVDLLRIACVRESTTRATLRGAGFGGNGAEPCPYQARRLPSSTSTSQMAR